MIQKNSTNRMFEEMRKAALQRLNGRTARDISDKTGIFFDEENSVFHVKSLGKCVAVSYPDFRCFPYETVKTELQTGENGDCLTAPEDGMKEWHLLTILHYMDLADGTPAGKNVITLSQMKSGMVRGGVFDRQCEQIIGQKIGNRTEAEVQSACKKMGAELIPSNADICAVFPFLPLCPVTLKIWFADEEIPGSGRILLNETADHFLTIEDAVTVGAVLLEELMERL